MQLRLLVPLFILCFFPFSQSYAQRVGYMGARYQISIGTGPGMSLFNGSAEYSGVRSKYDWRPGFGVLADADMALRNHLVVSLFGRFAKIQDSEFELWDGSAECQGCYVEHYVLKTTAFSLGLNLKAGFYDAPIGAYFLFGGGLTAANIQIHPSVITGVLGNGWVTSQKETRFEEGFERAYFPYLNIAGGRNCLLGKRVTLDFGVKSSLHFGGKLKNYSLGATFPSSSDIISEVATLVSLNNLRSAYAIEIYLKLGRIF